MSGSIFGASMTAALPGTALEVTQLHYPTELLFPDPPWRDEYTLIINGI